VISRWRLADDRYKKQRHLEMTKRLVELADYEINALLRLIALGDEHPRIDLTLESGMLSNERWWREYDEKTNTIQGDLMSVSIDLVSLGDRLKKVKS
jgi:hypothetical protein